MSYPPRWAMELLMAVQDYEDSHDKGQGCLHQALEKVPEHWRVLADGARWQRRIEEAHA